MIAKPTHDHSATDTKLPIILVVDDSEVNLMHVSAILEDRYDVRQASSGKEALKLAATAPRPDLILLDLIMPEMDGYQVAQLLRDNPATHNIPVIFVTAMVAEEDEQRGLALGAIDYMTKPLRPAILLARIRNHLELKHSRDVLQNQNELLETRVLERTKTLRAILDSADQTIAMIAPDGIIMTINRIGAERLQAKPTSLVGRSFFDLMTPEIADQHRQCVSEVVRRGEMMEMKDVRGEHTVHTTVFPVPGNPPRVVIYANDISNYVAAETALRKEREHLAAALEHQRELNHQLEDAQNQLLQSEKMASLGQLAAGVAHELNNPIGFVHSNLGTLEGYLHDIFEIADVCEQAAVNAASREDFASIEAKKKEKDFEFIQQDVFQLMTESKDGLNRVRKIVQDLKDFSRVGETHWLLADIHAGIDSTLNIVWNELKYKCTVVKHYGSDVPSIYCLPSQLNQVFMNLLVNAAHAIEERGEITISTERCDADTIRILISDTGHGIPPESQKRIFEPFFTTKPVGKGTGLGLSIAWGIVGKHHGKIEVASVMGKGTTFTITLPINPPAESPADKA
jgi:PAS domain S-box-containing protein